MGNANDLGGLAGEAAALDAELSGKTFEQAAAPGPQPAPGPSPLEMAKREVSLILEIMIGLFKPVSEKAAAVYTPEVIAEVSGAVGAVLVKYDISLLGIFARFEVEIKCAVVVLPVTWATIKAVRDDLEARAVAAARPVGPGPNGGVM